MKRTILLLWLLLTASASAQFMPFAMWKQAASAPAFNPITLGANLKYWFAADSITGKSNGDTVGFWRNLARSHTPSHLYQLTAAKKPVYRDSSGIRWVAFDGTDDVLRTGTDTSYSQPLTIFAVYRVPTSQADSYPLLDDNIGATLGFASAYFPTAGGGSSMDGTLLLAGGGGSDYPTRITAKSDSIRSQWVTYNGASSTYKHRSIAVEYTGTASTLSASGAMEGRSIGSGRASVETVTNLRGYLYEYAVYVGTMSDADRDAMYAYLRSKYGI